MGNKQISNILPIHSNWFWKEAQRKKKTPIHHGLALYPIITRQDDKKEFYQMIYKDSNGNQDGWNILSLF